MQEVIKFHEFLNRNYFRLDLNNRVTYFSDEFANWTKKNFNFELVENMELANIFDEYSYGKLNRLIKYVKNIRAIGDVVDFNFNKRHQGQYYCDCTPLYDAKGKATGVSVLLSKIHPPNNNGSILIDDFYFNSLDLVYRANFEGYFVDLNEQWQTATGFTLEELKSKPYLEFVHPDDLESTIGAIKILNVKNKLINFENRYITKSGDCIWLEWNARSDLKNGIIYAIGRNISRIKKSIEQQKSLAKDLEWTNHLLKTTNEMATIGTWELDVIKGELKWSELTKKIHEVEDDYVPDVATAINYYKEGDNRETISEAVENGIATGRSWDLELILITAKGNERTVRAIGLPQIEDGVCTCLYGTFQDITVLAERRRELEKEVAERTNALRQANYYLRENNFKLKDSYKILNENNSELQMAMENLKDAQSKLVQAEKMSSLGVLTAGVAHEINNPLNFIKSGTAVLKQIIADELNHELKENKNLSKLLKSIEIGVERAANIVSSLGNFSRNIEDDSSKFDLIKTLDECLIILQHEYKNNIEIKKRYSVQKLEIIGNQGNIYQVFINILKNSIDSIEGNGVITISAELNNFKPVLTISDTGKGISKENLSKIFDPFFTTKGAGEGTGLGLSIVYNILEKHDAKIDISSKINKGVTVRIEFPEI